MSLTIHPGSSPLHIRADIRPNCPGKWQCAWMYVHHSYGPGNIDGYFQLKYVNLGCLIHGKMPTGKAPVHSYASAYGAVRNANKGRYK